MVGVFLGAVGRIWTRTRTITDGGGSADIWTMGDDIGCRIAPVEGGIEEAGGRLSDRTTHIGTIAAYTEIEEGALLEIDGAGLYEVTAVRKRTYDELVRRVELVESDEQPEESS